MKTCINKQCLFFSHPVQIYEGQMAWNILFITSQMSDKTAHSHFFEQDPLFFQDVCVKNNAPVSQGAVLTSLIESALLILTFADFQINRVINVLGQFLAASSLFKNKSLEMEHQHRGQLFQSHSPTDLNLKKKQKKQEKQQNEMQSENVLWW